jgi:hypothetical protein
MKKQELINIIRTAVKQELRESLPKMIKEILNPSENHSPMIKETDPVKLTEQVLKNSKQVVSTSKKPKIKFSKNLAINEALNATRGGVPQEGSLVSGHQPHNEFTDLNGNTVDVDALPDHVSSALTKDYSHLLKAVDAKKGN